MMTEYQVVFNICATVQDRYDSTGAISYSGTTRVFDVGGYSLNNAKISLAICARSQWDAYDHGLQMLEEGNVDFGKANVETRGLDYVTDGNRSWSYSDLR